MKIKNIIPFLLILTLFFITNIFSHTISGFVNPIEWPGWALQFEVFYNYHNSIGQQVDPPPDTTDGSYPDPGYYSILNIPTDATNINVWAVKTGYTFDPPLIQYGPPLSGDVTQHFTATDIMNPVINITYPMDTTSPTDSTWIINTEDSLKFFVEDNSTWVTKYCFYYSIDNGINYAIIDSVLASTDREKRAIASDWGKPFSGSIKRTVFTPTNLNEYIFKFEAFDVDGKVGIGYSNVISVIDTIKPTVQVTAPNGSEVWDITSTYDITWTATDNMSVASRVIEYSSDNGSSWTLLDSIAGNTGTRPWTVPTPPSTQCLIKMRVYDQSNHMDEDISDAPFEVRVIPDPIDTLDPVVSVTTPTAGEIIQFDTTYDITWTATDDRGVDRISIYLNTGSGYSKLDSMDSNPGTWSWDIPNTPYPSLSIKVIAYDTTDNSGEDTSGSFETKDITPPQISIILPSKGTIVTQGTQYNVAFNASDNVALAYVSFYHSMDGGASWSFKDRVAYSVVDPSSSGIGTRKINTSIFEASSQCKVKVILYDEEGNYSVGFSDSLFTIKDIGPPSITITGLPDTLKSGTIQNIEWTANDIIGVNHILLSLSTDSGSTYNKLDSISPDTGSYLWTVPEIGASNCFIKAQAFDAAGNSAEDKTKVFFIETPVGIKPVVQKKLRVILTTHSILINVERAEKIPIKIFNIKGQPLYDKKLGTGFHKFPIEFAKGLYILQINNKSRKIILTKKFLQ